MDPRYFLGFDGGGTKTHACLIDENGTVVGEAYGPASSIDTVPLALTLASLKTAFEALPVRPALAAVFCGLGGIAGPQDVAKVVDAVRTLPFVSADTVVGADNDVMNALASGTGKLEGMALIIGTGSVCFGVHEGRKWRTGGYHYREGDAGSGFDLGFMALKHYARVLDHRLPRTAFADAIGEHLGISDFAALVRFFDRYGRTEVARLAPIVTSYATVDQFAYRIVVDAAEEIRQLVETVYRELGFADCDLTIVGGLGNADTFYRDLVLRNIAAIAPHIRIVKPVFDPARAAAAIALELAAKEGRR